MTSAAWSSCAVCAAVSSSVTVCCDPVVGVATSLVGVTGDGRPEMALALPSSVWEASVQICEPSVESAFEGEPSCDDSSSARIADCIESCRSMSDRSVSFESLLLHGHAQ